MTLTEFLLARIAEDEAKARAVMDWPEAPMARDLAWHTTPGDPRAIAWGLTCVAASTEAIVSEFIACHDPGRVLAECEAKRQIVALHAVIDLYDWNPEGHCEECSDSGWAGAVDGASPVSHPCPTLRLLSLPYADHPDYQDDWKP